MYDSIYQSFIGFSLGMAIITAIPVIAIVIIIWLYLRFVRSYDENTRKRTKPPPEPKETRKTNDSIQLTPEQVKAYFKAYGVDDKTINDILIKLFMK